MYNSVYFHICIQFTYDVLKKTSYYNLITFALEGGYIHLVTVKLYHHYCVYYKLYMSVWVYIVFILRGRD